MSRGKQAPKRKIQVDPIYHSLLVAKFINCVMIDGKKSTAQHIVYGAMEILKKKGHKDALATFEQSIEALRPAVEVRSRRVGGANYQVPLPVPSYRQDALAFRWLITASKGRKGRSMEEKLAGEIMDILEGVGAAMKKKDDVKRMAEANRAFAHFARFSR